MRVRIRQTDDLEAVAALDKACFPADLREDFSEQVCWLATFADDPTQAIGFTAMSYKPSADGEPAPRITRMGVIPAARGMRLQRRLAEVCARHAEAHGAPALYTYVSVYNIPSLRSLLHARFSPFACNDGWMQLGRWTKHTPPELRHASRWPQIG